MTDPRYIDGDPAEGIPPAAGVEQHTVAVVVTLTVEGMDLQDCRNIAELLVHEHIAPGERMGWPIDGKPWHRDRQPSEYRRARVDDVLELGRAARNGHLTIGPVAGGALEL